MPNLNDGLNPAVAATVTDYPNAESCGLLKILADNLAEEYPNPTERRNLTAKQVYDFVYEYCYTASLVGISIQAQRYCMSMIYNANGLTGGQRDEKLKKFGLQLATGQALQDYESPFYITFCGCAAGFGSAYEAVDGGVWNLKDCAKATVTCAVGKYLDNATNTCRSCPGGGTSAAGTTAVTGCYITGGTDNSGTFNFGDTGCYYQQKSPPNPCPAQTGIDCRGHTAGFFISVPGAALSRITYKPWRYPRPARARRPWYIKLNNNPRRITMRPPSIFPRSPNEIFNTRAASAREIPFILRPCRNASPIRRASGEMMPIIFLPHKKIRH